MDQALRSGSRNLPGGSSLSLLLNEERGVPFPNQRDDLDESHILMWADAHFQRTGQWPRVASGAIPEAPGETWEKVSSALRFGMRGLPGKTTLAKLLKEKREVRPRGGSSDLTLDQIRVWIASYHQRTGKWPTATSGSILDAPGETWKGVHLALYRGRRRLTGGSSLARVVREYRSSLFP